MKAFSENTDYLLYLPHEYRDHSTGCRVACDSPLVIVTSTIQLHSLYPDHRHPVGWEGCMFEEAQHDYYECGNQECGRQGVQIHGVNGKEFFWLLASSSFP